MLASQLFWRIFAVYAALTVLTTLVFAGILSFRHRAAMDQQLRERLRDDVTLIRDLWVREGSPEMPLTATLSRLLQLDFLVKEKATKSADREIQQALRDGEGYSQRTAAASQRTEMFYALRIGPADSPRGVLRASLPREESSLAATLFDWKIWIAAVLLVGIGLAFTYRIVSRIIGPLETLTLAARQIAAGQSPKELRIYSRNEIGTLAQAFNSMNRQLASRITDLQEQRRRLQHNNEQLETVLGAMVEGVIAVDDQERIILANNAAFHLLDMTPTAMVGRPIWEAIRQPRIDDLVRQALRGESPERLELQVSRVQNIISAAVSRLPGEPCPGAVLVLHDVTELRRLERLRREFVANVSHELKTPLTSIAAYTETLLDGALDDPQHNKEFLKRIEEQTDRLQALIVDLLSLARMESDESKYELAPVDVAEVIADSFDAHHGVADAKQIHLQRPVSEEPSLALADAEGLRTILDNLLDNAINYTPPEGRVTVQWWPEGDWVHIDVSDTGVGIAKEHQARIFERFFRVDKARSREVGGTGLGLTIVKHLCQTFGGSVSVTSQVNQGSTFRVSLKRAAPTAME